MPKTLARGSRAAEDRERLVTNKDDIFSGLVICQQLARADLLPVGQMLFADYNLVIDRGSSCWRV